MRDENGGWRLAARGCMMAGVVVAIAAPAARAELPEAVPVEGETFGARLVAADTGLLATLPRREWRNGLAETVKAAVIGVSTRPGSILSSRSRSSSCSRSSFEVAVTRTECLSLLCRRAEQT